MQNKIIFLFFFLFIFLLSYVEGQDNFKGNSGEPFTPSTIIIIIMAVVFLFTGCLAVFLRRFSQGCFGLHIIPINPGITADGQLATHGLDAEVIKSIPTYFYADVKQHRKGQVELECAVCLNEFQDPETLRLLPGCSHVFHPRCIDQWLAAHVTCPICRQSLEKLQPGFNTNKPHTIINITNNNIVVPTPLDDDQSDGPHHMTHPHDHEGTGPTEATHDDVKKIIVGKFPRSHSTGHSMADSERFRLVLPEEVQNNLTNRPKGLGSILSPRSGYKCGWFSMTPPVTNTRSNKLAPFHRGLVVSNSCKNLTLAQVKTSDRSCLV